jgi:hypothetical protein
LRSDRVAQISALVREVIDGGDGWCATLEIAGQPTKWVQFTDGVVNAAYAHPDHPDDRLRDLGGLTLETWSPNEYLTGALGLSDPREIAGWIDRYFETILGATPGYAIDGKTEIL